MSLLLSEEPSSDSRLVSVASVDASPELLTVEEEAAVEEELLVLPNASNSVELVLSVEFVLSELLAPVEADSVPFELSMSVSEL
jgi:hypothetical protein